MADDRSITGSAGAAEVHDDDELADVLAAELERYATGAVPTLSVPRAQTAPFQPLATPSVDARPTPPPPVAETDQTSGRRSRSREDRDFSRRAAEVERVLRDTAPSTPMPPRDDSVDDIRRPTPPSGRRSATGPVTRPSTPAVPDGLPLKRRTGFRPPQPTSEALRAEPVDLVLPAAPVNPPQPTGVPADAVVSQAAVPDAFAVPVPVEPLPVARHAAPRVQPEPRTDPVPGPAASTGPAATPDGLYEDWEQSLRSIGRPRPTWEIDDEIVPTNGDVDLATVALPVQQTGPVSASSRTIDASGGLPFVLPPDAPTAGVPFALAAEPPQRGAHALPGEPAAEPAPTARRRRTGRRRAAAPEDAAPEPHPTPADDAEAEADAEGIDEVVVGYPIVSAATTGAIDLPSVEPRPRTAPVLIERVRTALLQLPSIPPSPTGSGAGAIVGRWFGAYASPLTLVLAFGLAAAGAGSASAAAVVLGALIAGPSIARSAAWSASVRDDSVLHEVEVLGPRAGRALAVMLLVSRLAAAAAVVFGAGSLAGSWVARTGALGSTTPASAATLGCVVVAVGALICAVLPTRATAILVLLSALAGTVGTVLVALVLAPNGGAPAATTPSGAVAAVVAGFAAVGLVLVLCGPDVARWRTDLARPASSAVGVVVALVLGAALLAAGTLIAVRLGGRGVSVDEFAGALSDASASALASPLLVILLVSSLTLPALLLRSSGAAAARLIGGGRPVRLGTTAAMLLALAGALGLLGSGLDTDGAVLAVAAAAGVPVAAWAGVLVLRSSARSSATSIGMVVAVLIGWACCDGLVPGFSSPVLDALGVAAASGMRGGPAAGLLVAFVLGLVAGSLGRAGGARPARSVSATPDTVEG